MDYIASVMTASDDSKQAAMNSLSVSWELSQRIIAENNKILRENFSFAGCDQILKWAHFDDIYFKPIFSL